MSSSSGGTKPVVVTCCKDANMKPLRVEASMPRFGMLSDRHRRKKEEANL